MDYRDFNADIVPLDFLQLALHCKDLSEGRQMPSPHDFRLHDIPWLYGRFYVIDVLDQGADYRFDEFGIFWQAIYGDDLTGKRLSEIEEAYDNLDVLRGQFDGIVASRSPVLSLGKLVWPSQETIVYQRFLIPLSTDDVAVSRIIVAAHYNDDVEELVFYRGEGLPRLLVEEMDLAKLAKAS